MSNSWRQYGGISRLDSFNTIQAGTIVADQFLSRSAKPSYQFYNGTIEVTVNLIADQDVISGNSLYVGIDSFVKGNSYINKKLYFGQTNTLLDDNTHAYMAGNSTNIGVNTTAPSTVFNITGRLPVVTDILTVESKNGYIRNILGQNINQRGLVLDASDSNTNLYFFNDVSTSKSNIPNASITYSTGGTLSTWTTNLITSSAREFQYTNSGGLLKFNGYKTQWDSSGWFIYNTSGGIVWTTSGDVMKLDAATGNFLLNTSGDMVLNSEKGFYLNTSGGIFALNKNTGILSCSGSLLFNSSAGVININSNLGTGNVYLKSNTSQLTSFLSVAPPPLSTQTTASGELYNETVLIYDNSHNTYLYEVYQTTTAQTGTAITIVAEDNSSNTFFRAVAPNNMGLAINGGVFPLDSSRSMVNIGLTDVSQNYIPNQTIVSGKSKVKYVSTTGINTYAPRTENYSLDVNGPFHLGNGEINTILRTNFEIKYMSFSKTYPQSGVAVGTISSHNTTDYQNSYYILYTKNGGQTWTNSQIFIPDVNASSSITLTVNVYDTSYAFVATRNANLNNTIESMHYTSNGGANWARISYSADTSVRYTGSISTLNNGVGSIRAFHTYYYHSSYGNNFYRRFDVSTNALTGTTYTIPSSTEYSIGIQVTASDSSGSFLYLVGSGVAKINVASSTVVYANSRTDVSYNNVFAYNDTYVIAVGNNILSYTTDGTSWTDISTNQNVPGTSSRFANLNTSSNINLQSVFIYDLSRAVAVGDNGVFIYTSAGPSAGAWTMDANNTLNTNGMGSQITGNTNMLRGVNMPDLNSFVIANSTTQFVSGVKSGSSKMLYGFFPNLMNRVNNRVFDVSGNMYISGDINVNDLGLIASNNQTFYLLNNVVRTLNFVRDSSFINIANFNTNTTLNGNLFVTNNSFMALDVSMANRLFVLNDTSLNSNTYVKGNITIPSTSTVFTSIINSSDLSPLYNGANANQIGNLVVGGNTLVTSIGHLDVTRYNALSNQMQSANKRGSYINIGSSNPLYDTSTVSINIGNWSTNVNAKSNYINVGGGTDLLTLAGNIFFKNTQKLLVNNPVIIVNTQTNTGVNSSSGIFGYASGTTLVITTTGESTNVAIGQIVTGSNITSGTTITALVTGTGGTGTYTISPTQVTPSGTVGSPVALKFTTNYASTGTFGYISGGNLIVTAIATGTILIGQSVTVTGSASAISITGFVSGSAGGMGTYTISSSPSVTTFASSANPVALTFIPSTVQLANGYGTSSGSGLYINDNNLQNSGYVVVSYDMSAYNFRATNTNSNVVRLDTNSMTLYPGTTYNTKPGINSLNNGIVTLARSTGTALADSSYTLSVAQIDISNILLRDSNTSNDTNQNILTGVTIQGDVSMNNRLFVLNDASFMSNMYIDNDLDIRGRLTVSVYQNRTIINTTTTNYLQLLVDTDTSLNGRLVVTQDVSLNARLFLASDASLNSRLNVGGDVSLNSRIFVGGDASLNSRLNVGADVSLNRRLFVGGDASLNSRLNVGGDVSLNSRIFVGGDASLNSRLNVGGDVSLNSRIFVGGDASLNSRLNVGGDVSLNSRLFVSRDASLNASIYVAKNAWYGVSGSLFNFDVSGTVNLRGTVNTITLIDNSVLVSNTPALDFANCFAVNWVKNFSNTTYAWSGVCMSLLGQYQLVFSKTNISGGPYLNMYQSNDYGVTWSTPFSGTANNNPSGAAISATGQYIVYVVSGSGIYLSSNYGSSYTQINVVPLAYSCIAMSSTGAYLTTGVDNGAIYVSTNYGASWAAQTTGSILWTAVAMSANGQYQCACASSGLIYYNHNYGLNNNAGAWTAAGSITAKPWKSISMSSSGQYQSACESGGIWISANYGVSWSQPSGLSNWTSVSVNSSGQYQVATMQSGAVYVSNNYGLTWTARPGAPTNCTGSAISGNGQYLLTCNSAGTFNATTPYPSMYINNGLSVISDFSMNGRMMVYGDVSFNSRLNVQGDVSLNARIFVAGDASFNARLNVAADVSLNRRLFVGGDVSFNQRLYVQRNLYVGYGAGTNINGNTNTFTVDISAANTNSAYYAGAMRIWEASGTLPTASGGTLFLQHGDVSGVSSIVFPSTTNFGTDYASIAYYDSISGGLSKGSRYNYYSNTKSTSSSALVINVQSNPYLSTDASSIDSLILQPAGSCIIDACGSTVMGQTIIQPKGGNVGIGKIRSLYPLDVTSQEVSYTTSGNPNVSYYGNYTILTYSTVGSGSLTMNTSTLYNTVPFGYIVVGGGGIGGDGGGYNGGGGAGGAVSYGFIGNNPAVNANFTTGASYTVTVGSGGIVGGSPGLSSVLFGTNVNIAAAQGGNGAGGIFGDQTGNGGIVSTGSNGPTINVTANGGEASNGFPSAVMYSPEIGYNQFASSGGGGGSGGKGGTGGTLSRAGIAGGSANVNGTNGAPGCGGGGGSGTGTGGNGGNGYIIIYFNTFINQPASASFNNSVLFNNGAVGIGLGQTNTGTLVTPSFPLDISSNSTGGTVRIGGNISYPPVGSSPYSGQLIITTNTNYNASKLVMGMSYTSNAQQAGYIQSTQYSTTDTSQLLLLNPAGGNVAIGKNNAGYSLDVSGSFNCSGPVIFTGDVSLNNRLFVSSDVSLNSNLYTRGNTTIAGNLSVTTSNVSTFTGNLTAANLITGGNLTVLSTGNSTIAGNLTVGNLNAGALVVTSISSRLFTGNLTSDGNLTVSGTGDISGNLIARANMAIGPSAALSATYVLNVNGNVQANSYNASSDMRIKTNVVNIDGTFALNTLRKLEPKQFRFIDAATNNELSWGFIAQDVNDVLSYTTNKSTNFIPNIYDNATVSEDGIVLHLSTITTDKFIAGITKMRIITNETQSNTYNLVKIIDTQSFAIEPPIIGCNSVFVYGQQVDDFMSINHNSIFTISTAAIKQLDQELQLAKHTLETQALQIRDLQSNLEFLMQSNR